MRVRFRNSIYNKVYLPYRNSESPLEIFYGSASSGKSYFIAQRFVVRMLRHNYYNILTIRKVSASNHDSTFSLMRQIISRYNLEQLFKINETKGDESITAVTGSQMLFKGMKDEREREKVKSITFKNGVVNHIWAEEASELNQKDLDQLFIRLRGTSDYKKQVTISFNPISKNHWLKRRYFDYTVKDCTILKTTYKDNRFLDPGDRKRIENLKDNDYIYYQIYALGEWGEIGNTVFSRYKIITCPYKLDDFDDIVQGMDFGYEHPSVFEIIGIKDGQPYWYDEECQTHLTNTEWIDFLESRYTEMGILDSVKHRRTVADSAEPNRIKEFRERGWNVREAAKGKSSVRYGVDYLRSKIMTIDPSCERMAAEVEVYRNKEDKNGEIDDQEYINEFDDAIAASRYALEDKWSKVKVKAAKHSAAVLGF